MTDTTIKDIISAATKKGACQLTDTVTDIDSLVRLFFSPQGKEFCKDHNFPTLEILRQLQQSVDLSKYGIYVDAGSVRLCDEAIIAIAGQTQAELIYEGVECRHSIIMMHGATATVKAANHAVIEVINCGCCIDYEIDKTVILL